MKATEQLVHDLKKMYLPQNRCEFWECPSYIRCEWNQRYVRINEHGISNHSYYWKEWIGEEYLSPTGAMLLSLQVARGNTS